MTQALKKSQCPLCSKSGNDRSKDNLIHYSDGSFWCFSCNTDPMKEGNAVIKHHSMHLKDRRISKDTCEHYGMGIGRDSDADETEYYVFNLYQGSKLLAQKVRDVSDKSRQSWRLNGTCNKLFGQSTFTPTMKVPVVITEGEFDAMAVYEATGLPAVSVTKGAACAVKQIKENLDWLQQFKYVILCFDMDAPGQAAVDNIVPVFEVGTLKVARLPTKDVNELLIKAGPDKVKEAMWAAEVIRPNTILTPAELTERVLIRPEAGTSWPWKSMTQATYGFRTGEIYVLAAAEGVGKTEAVKELIFHRIQCGDKVGVFSLEQSPEDTVRRLIGGKLNKRLHIPGEAEWDEVAIKKELEALTDKLFVYNTRIASLPLEKIILNIRFLVRSHGVKFIVIDNLTALCSSTTWAGKYMRDVEYVGVVMNQLFSVIKELDVTILVVSHLATDKISKTAYVSTASKPRMNEGAMEDKLNPEGMTWESGRMPTLENIYGSGTVRKLADYIMVLARNRVSEEYDAKRTTNVKFLKTRIDSMFEGKAFKLKYDYDTGRLREV